LCVTSLFAGTLIFPILLLPVVTGLSLGPLMAKSHAPTVPPPDPLA
jgi:hypothetical protein